jgi:NADPH:quinone reductase-like Zn-dependent oxidoreductase
VAAFLDTYGGYVPLALALGVPAERIDTIIMNDQSAIDAGVNRKGMSSIEDPGAAVAELAVLVTTGEVQVPIKGRYPLSDVGDAYRDLASRGGLGKIVLDIAPR